MELLFFAYFTGFLGVDKNPVKLVSMRGHQNTSKKLVDWIFKPSPNPPDSPSSSLFSSR